MIKRQYINNSVEGAQAPSTMVVVNPNILTLQKEGSDILISSNRHCLLGLSFKTSTGKDVTYSYELIDNEEGSLWQEFMKLLPERTSEITISKFRDCALEFIEQNAGRQVEVSFRFFNYKQNRNWLFPDTKPRFRFI